MQVELRSQCLTPNPKLFSLYQNECFSNYQEWVKRLSFLTRILYVCPAECLASSQPSAPASCWSRLELPFDGTSQAQATSLTLSPSPPPPTSPHVLWCREMNRVSWVSHSRCKLAYLTQFPLLFFINEAICEDSEFEDMNLK